MEQISPPPIRLTQAMSTITGVPSGLTLSLSQRPILSAIAKIASWPSLRYPDLELIMSVEFPRFCLISLSLLEHGCYRVLENYNFEYEYKYCPEEYSV